MLQVMLCGASDTERVRREFEEVVTQFGGVPLHYLSGHVLHTNAHDASWARNSRATVQAADLCVFVVLENFGGITWTIELREALAAGKPFLVFCAKQTYQNYLSLTRNIVDLTAIVDNEQRQLVTMLREIESQRKLTVVPFDEGYLRDELRRQFGYLFQTTLLMLQTRNVRQGAAHLLGALHRITPSDVVIITEIALDETEDKNLRKRSIQSLAASSGMARDTVEQLLKSWEQGVSRLTVDLMSKLYRTRPPEKDFLAGCVAHANASDDVGVRRRMVSALLEMDIALGLEALEQLDLDDVGTRRRLAAELEENENLIYENDVVAIAVTLCDRCLLRPSEVGWEERLMNLQSRLRGRRSP